MFSKVLRELVGGHHLWGSKLLLCCLKRDKRAVGIATFELNFFFPYVGGVPVSVLFLVQAPVVQKLDSAIHRLNH